MVDTSSCTDTQFVMVLCDHISDSIQFQAAETAACLKANRREPELRNPFVTLHVHVPRFRTIASVEEESIWPFA
jgi:hypothetical protein